METKIDRIRKLAVDSINKASGESAAEINPPHTMVEGTKVFTQAATDFLCSLIDVAELEALGLPDEVVARTVARRVARMLRVAAIGQ